jgi:hypothetical protein
MKNYTITTYSFDELSQEAQDAALAELCDINVDIDWWSYIYEDAENIGAKITSFDIDRGSYCNMEFTDSAISIAEKIVKEHGEMCDTYKTAQKFMAAWQSIFNDYMDKTSKNYESSESEDEMLDLENEFKKSLEEDYRIILSKEYDYLCSEEAIKESIEANDYEFLSTGKMY